MKRLPILFLVLALVFPALFTACDNRLTMAWHEYRWAKDTLEAGYSYIAKKILEQCDTTVDSVLALKVDSLMKVIDLTIAQKEQGQQE